MEGLRQTLNVEYLKNIVLSFVEAGSKDQLIPVLARVLQLTQDEEQRLKKATNPAGPAQRAPTFGFF